MTSEKARNKEDEDLCDDIESILGESINKKSSSQMGVGVARSAVDEVRISQHSEDKISNSSTPIENEKL